MRYIFYAFWVLTALLAASFASLNPQKIVLNYYVNTKAIYLPIVLLIVLIIGSLLGMIAMLPIIIRNKNYARRLKHQVRQVQEEVKNLRAIPLRDTH